VKYFTNTKSTMLTAIILLSSVNAYALSANAKEGKVLYTDANCMKCHGISPKFDPKQKKATDFEKVNSWVRACDSSLEIGWFPEEQKSVAQYLNESHYKHSMK